MLSSLFRTQKTHLPSDRNIAVPIDPQMGPIGFHSATLSGTKKVPHFPFDANELLTTRET